ncbi:hypothetical protein F5Y05DRAFT_420688 [Hypoxylon sp. FL0543]|nr:hypothetical protein F5Y05DRAFT_420688 [Hypoxylon sp. FL0543]
MNNQLASEGGSGGGIRVPSISQHQANSPRSNCLSHIPQTNDPHASNQEQNQTKAQIPLPQHFVVRPGVTKHTASGTVTSPGPIVPLVAVDQLPEWLDLSGVPRELSVEQTVGLTNLGTAIRNPEFYTVYMHRSFEAATAAIASDNIAMPAPTAQARRPGQMDRVQHTQAQTLPHRLYPTARAEDKDNELLIPVNSPVVASASQPAPPGAVSVAGAPASTTNPATTSPTSGSRNNGLPSRTRGNSSTNTSPPKQQNPGVASNIPIGLHPRLPSPTATGSTPPANSNPYPVLHHYPQLPPHPHHHHPYAMPIAAAPPPSMHPADRMLQSWYQPLNPYSHHKPSAAAPARQKNNPGNSNNSNNSNNTTAGGGGGSGSSSVASIYCRHWCHRGTCRWGTQCRYAHAMPATAEGLREVGLAHPPAWWTAAVNIGLAYGGGVGGFGLGGLGGAAWYPPGRHHGGGGGGKKAQKDKDKDKERNGGKEGGEAKEKDKDKEKGKDKDKEKDGAGKGGKSVVENKNGGGAGPNVKLEKKDTKAEKAGAVGGDQGKKKVEEQPKEEQKLVEI